MNRLITSMIVLMLNGCSAYGLYFGETKPQVTYVELPNKNSLYVWSPKNTAAVFNKDGKGCIQGAEVYSDKSGSLSISDDVLKTLSGINVSNGSTEKQEALAVSLTNDLLQLRTNTEVNSFLSIGMFGICQLQINGGLSQEHTNNLVLDLTTKAMNLIPEKKAE